MVESVVCACLMEYDERATLNFIIGSGRSSRKKERKKKKKERRKKKNRKSCRQSASQPTSQPACIVKPRPERSSPLASTGHYSMIAPVRAAISSTPFVSRGRFNCCN